ncbi:MAG: RDD family protein [Solobacterium sp.]|nr:RDD family protein [Solobacterium sp.]
MSKNKQLRKKTTENTQNNQNAFLARRGFAFVIDFIITNRLSLFVTGIVYGLMNNGNIQILNGFEGIQTTQILVLLLSVLIAHGFYFVFVPAKITGGSTMMQKVMQVKVVREDGNPATLKDFALLYFVGSVLCEGLFYDAFGVILSGIFFGIFMAEDISRIIYIVSAISSVLSLIMALMDKGKYRFFHDKISKTIMKDEYVPSGKVL